MGPSLPMSPERALLLQAVCHVDPDRARCAWVELVERLGDVAAVCAWMRQGGEERLLPLLGDRADSLDLPEPVRVACDESTAVAWGLNERLLATIRPVIDAWSAAGISAVAVKGLGLVGDVYSHHRLRPFGDADLVVEPAQLRHALAQLRGMGWRVRRRTLWEFVGDGAAVSYYRPGASLDLHQRPARNYPYRPRGRYDLLIDAEPVPAGHPLAATSLRRPVRAHHAVLLAAHLARPVNAHVAHPVADLHRLLCVAGEPWAIGDAERLLAAARREVLSLRVAGVLRSLHDLLGTPLPVDLQDLTSPSAKDRRAEERAMLAERRLESRRPGLGGAVSRYGDLVAVASAGQPLGPTVRVAVATAFRWVALRVAR